MSTMAAKVERGRDGQRKPTAESTRATGRARGSSRTASEAREETRRGIHHRRLRRRHLGLARRHVRQFVNVKFHHRHEPETSATKEMACR